jgi:uncharacterized protein (TIGR02231 family)
VAEATVVRIELFQDRCLVVRRLAIATTGRSTHVLTGLSPLIRERGVSFAGEGIVVEDLSVRRDHASLTDADTEIGASLEQERQLLAHRHLSESAEARRAGARARRAETVLEAARGQTGRALTLHDDPEGWLESLRALGDAHREALRASVQAEQRAQRTRLELDHIERRLDAARAGRSQQSSRVSVRVLADHPGDLEIRTVIPGAVWRPLHRATLTGDLLTWELAAMVWNVTGEDWEGVELVCSTARPGDHAHPPALTDDVVRTQRRGEVVVDVREEAVHEVRATEQRVSTVPGVDDGGEPRTFTARGPISLRSHGQPVQVPLDRWSGKAQTRWEAHPERAPEVVLRSTQTHAGTRPLLPGPVTLVRDGIAIGTGEIPLVSPGESFRLGWGSHDGIRVTRRRDHEANATLITGHQTHTFHTELRVVHLGTSPLSFTLLERVATSEVKEVKIGEPRAAPAFTSGPDRDGFCSWDLTLDPGETRKLTYEVQLEAPAKITLPF